MMVGLVLFPYADLKVMVGGEGEVVKEGDGFGGVQCGFDVELVEGGASVPVIDVDFVVCWGVEEVVLDGKGGDRVTRVQGDIDLR